MEADCCSLGHSTLGNYKWDCKCNNLLWNLAGRLWWYVVTPARHSETESTEAKWDFSSGNGLVDGVSRWKAQWAQCCFTSWFMTWFLRQRCEVTGRFRGLFIMLKFLRESHVGFSCRVGTQHMLLQQEAAGLDLETGKFYQGPHG